MTAFVLVLVALVGVFVLWRFDLLPLGKEGGGGDTAAALRELLLARAEGRITTEEFARQEAALHAKLLAAGNGGGARRKAVFLWLVPVVVTVVAIALYASRDERKDALPLPGTVAEPPLLSSPAPDKKGQANSGGDLKTMVKRLADKMEKDPDNGEGWLLLARTYGELRQHADAAKAYAKAAALLPPDASLFADWADAYVVAHDRKWDDAARDMVKRALAADSKHLKALALAGSEAFERGDNKAAIGYWKRMKAAAPPDSMDARLADANIEEATAAAGGKKREAGEAPPPAAAAGAISGVITLDAGLKGKVEPGDTIFLVAKAPDGSSPPLAAQRFKAGDLPIRFSLDDSMAMVPGRSLSKFGEAILSARISRSGDAVPQPGDIASAPMRAKLGSGDVALTLGKGK